MLRRNCHHLSLQRNSETSDEEGITKSLFEKKKREGTYEQWRQESREKQRFYYQKSKGKVKDPIIAKQNDAKRKEKYKKTYRTIETKWKVRSLFGKKARTGSSTLSRSR